jgi:hypothetical protein
MKQQKTMKEDKLIEKIKKWWHKFKRKQPAMISQEEMQQFETLLEQLSSSPLAAGSLSEQEVSAIFGGLPRRYLGAR